jgi:hypothetical protein
MNDIAIRVENLYKRYRIGTKQASYGSLRESLMNAVTAPIQRIQKNNVGTQDSSPSLSPPPVARWYAAG